MRGEIVAKRAPCSRTMAFALVVIFLFLTPVQTYSGAERPHAHAMFQLVAEALHLIPPHGHAGEDHRTPRDPAATEQVVYRSDHPLNTMFGDRERAPRNAADPPVLTKVSLAYATYAPALVPQSSLSEQPPERAALLRGDSVAIPTGREIAPDPPPPKAVSLEPDLNH